MNLASIEKITEIKPIDGADKIEAARVLGYWTVIKKGEFNVGDLCVWHNPDTIIDITNPAYSFLKNSRLKVIKLRKQVSQGLALPLSAFKWDTILSEVSEGLDVSYNIKITKYEKPEGPGFSGIQGTPKLRTFPTFIPRTDEQNIRSAPKLLHELLNSGDVFITIKIDGQSATFYKKDDHFGLCSRNMELKNEEESGLSKLEKKCGLLEAIKACNRNIAIQGECYGPSIQGNKCGVDEVKFAAFNIYDIDNHKYLNKEQFDIFCLAYNIPTVKTIYQGPLQTLMPNNSIDDLVEYANSQHYSPGKPAEGIVIRPLVDKESDAVRGRQMSGKIISEVFSLKYGE